MPSEDFTIEKIYELYRQCNSVCTDTRRIQEGDLFIALKGPHYDANDFVTIALDKGAKAVVCERCDDATDSRIVVVPDSLQTLQVLARFHRNLFTGKVIGLTGSNGKTTTKELLYQVLRTKYSTYATRGNLNNHIGVPLTLLAIPKEAEMVIVEMGANAIGNIEELCKIAEPDYGLITNIGKAHLEGFGGIEGVLIGKTELYRHLEDKNGTIFYNTNSSKLISRLPKSTVNIPYQRANVIRDSPDIVCRINSYIFRSELYGIYNVQNIEAAVTVGAYFDVGWEAMVEGIQNYVPQNNRSSKKVIKGATVYFDAYNANPTSMTASLESFEKLNEDKKMVIIGDMLELGKEAEIEHQMIAEKVIRMNFDRHYFIGPVFSSLGLPYSFKSVTDFIHLFEEIELSGWTILIKGSRGIKLETIFD